MSVAARADVASNVAASDKTSRTENRDVCMGVNGKGGQNAFEKLAAWNGTLQARPAKYISLMAIS